MDMMMAMAQRMMELQLRESIWYKLLPMDGAPWIHDILAILDHFAIWARSKTCQENIVLIFFGSQCKIQGKINAQINFGHNF